jgi:hypothetical protein
MTPAEIAASLTPAQRIRVSLLARNGSWGIAGPGGAVLHRNLSALGLVKDDPKHANAHRLTYLGRLVAAALLRAERGER